MSELLNFVENKMKMTSIYQPMLIANMCKNAGCINIDVVGKEIATKLDGNTKRANYFAGKMKIYPKQVLAKHGIATTSHNNTMFSFTEQYTDYSFDEYQLVKNACYKKVKDYLAKKEK